MCDSTVMDSLQTQQNKLLKILCQRDSRYATVQLHNEVGILKCNDVQEMYTNVFVYKQQRGLLPSVFNQYYIQSSDVSSRCTRQNTRDHLYEPKYRTSGGQKSLKYHGTKLWNSLSEDVKSEPTLSLFKKSIMSKLLAHYET